jgi:hypothetical protein
MGPGKKQPATQPQGQLTHTALSPNGSVSEEVSVNTAVSSCKQHGRLSRSTPVGVAHQIMRAVQQTAGNQAALRLLRQAELQAPSLSNAPRSDQLQRVVVLMDNTEKNPPKKLTGEAKDLHLRDPKQDTVDPHDFPKDFKHVVVTYAASGSLKGLKKSAEPILLFGHGTLARNGEGQYFSPVLARLSAEQIADWLIKQKLPKSYQGQIFLVSCHSSTGDEASLANTLLTLLREKGYEALSVKGTLGISMVRRGPDPISGEQRTIVDVLEDTDQSNKDWVEKKEAYVTAARRRNELEEKRQKAFDNGPPLTVDEIAELQELNTDKTKSVDALKTALDMSDRDDRQKLADRKGTKDDPFEEHNQVFGAGVLTKLGITLQLTPPPDEDMHELDLPGEAKVELDSAVKD